MESHTVNNKDLEKINYCCMYIKVEHVTGIATSDGKRIHSQLLENQEDVSIIRSTQWNGRDNNNQTNNHGNCFMPRLEQR
eukprot:11068100-Ditylum_brightwellii.AAC.1